ARIRQGSSRLEAGRPTVLLSPWVRSQNAYNCSHNESNSCGSHAGRCAVREGARSNSGSPLRSPRSVLFLSTNHPPTWWRERWHDATRVEHPLSAWADQPLDGRKAGFLPRQSQSSGLPGTARLGCEDRRRNSGAPFSTRTTVEAHLSRLHLRINGAAGGKSGKRH